MGIVLLEEKYVLEYIRDLIQSFKIKSIEVNNAKFHHNCSYSKVPSILKNGILSISELNKLNIIQASSKELSIMEDMNSHANGIDYISLSVVGLKDLYSYEFEYDPFDSNLIDLNISSDIIARRSTVNYGNEFLCKDKIIPNKIKSLDIRLLKLIDSSIKKNNVNVIIERYNELKNVALAIKEYNLDIPLREMSFQNLTLDIDKLSKTDKILIK